MARPDDPRIPAIGAVPQQERLFRVNWVATELRAPSGAGLLPPEFVAQQGRRIKIVDLRQEDELRGPLGLIPGAEWASAADCDTIPERFERDVPFVFVSRGGERAATVARALEQRGMGFCAAMMGGIVAWKQLGFATVRESAVLREHGLLRPHVNPPPRQGLLSEDDVLQHIGDPSAVRWMRMAAMLLHGRLSCVDGRADSGVVGTPGGDTGELVLGLSAVEHVTGRRFSREEVARTFRARLDAFGRFYVHGDVDAGNELIKSIRAHPQLGPAVTEVWESLEWRRFLYNPPADLHDDLLALMLEPRHTGCGHLRLMMQHPERYGVRAALVQDVTAAFLRAHWAGSPETEYVVLGGGHAEGAVIDVRLSEEVWPFSQVPLISPQCEGAQVFVVHSQVVKYLRRQLAELLARSLGLSAEQGAAAAARMAELGDLQAAATLSALAPGLPVYEVCFGPAGVQVQARGHIPAAG